MLYVSLTYGVYVADHVQFLPILGAGQSGQSGHSSADGGGSSSCTVGAMLPVQSLGGAAAAGATFILSPAVYADHDLATALLVNG